jgi:hypothetical protein
MTKDEALKMAIDDAITKFINDVSDDNDSDSTWQSYAVQAAEMIRIRIQNACKEALADNPFCKHGLPRGVCRLGEKDCD